MILRRGSKKGLSRRHLEGGNTAFREYDPVGVRPSTDDVEDLILEKSAVKQRGRESKGPPEII